MDSNNHDCLGQVDELLALRNQSWLFGAVNGYSHTSGAPVVLQNAVDTIDQITAYTQSFYNSVG